MNGDKNYVSLYVIETQETAMLGLIWVHRD
jgi:hypothetical protein